MAHIPLGKSRRIAIDQIIAQLRAHLADEIATARAGLPLTPKPGMPAPAANAYHSVEPLHPDAVDRAQEVWVHIYPAGPRVVEEERSGGPEHYSAQTTIDLIVVLTFRARPGDAIPNDGVADLPQDVTMRYRQEAYGEAIINTMTKHAKQADAIHEVSLVGDETEAIYEGQWPVYGVASSIWRITQIVSVPQAIC